MDIAILPVITDKVLGDYFDTHLITLNKDSGKWEWTQDAVEFAALVAGHIQRPSQWKPVSDPVETQYDDYLMLGACFNKIINRWVHNLYGSHEFDDLAAHGNSMYMVIERLKPPTTDTLRNIDTGEEVQVSIDDEGRVL